MRFYFILIVLFAPLFIISQPRVDSPKMDILVRFHDKVNAYDFVDNFHANSRTKMNFEIKRQISQVLNIYSVEYNGLEDAGDQIILALKKNRLVLDIGYDSPVKYRNTTPNDEFFTEQWNLEKIQLPQVWDETTGGTTAKGDKIVIAVLEMGIELDHPDLLGNMWRNEHEIPNNNKDDDNNGYVDDYFGLNLNDLTDNHPVLSHGTQVSGIIGAKSNNGIGMAGINWESEILFMSGVDLASEVIEAYEYLYNLRKKYNETNGREGAFVVVNNNSFGWDNTRPENLSMGIEMCQMYDIMGAVGILSVGAGPNNDVDVEVVGDTPTNCTSRYFIGVTSTDEKDAKSRDGGYGGISIDIAAPGENIRATNIGKEYGLFSGTSFATPHITGAIGLMYSLPCEQLADDAITNAAQTANFLKNILLAGTDPITGLADRTVSGGRLNVFKAMTNLQAYCGTSGGEKLSILSIFPNPSSDKLTLVYETPDFEEYTLMISNTLGQVVFEKNIIPPRFTEPILSQDIAWLSPGIYFMTIQRNGSHVSQRFVVDRLAR